VLGDSSCRKLDDKKNVETFEAQGVYGEEVAGEKGVPVGRKKSFP
jgi:hypothetical protein